MNELGYELLDAGDGRKLERFGRVSVVRPAPAATGPRRLRAEDWDARFAEYGPSAPDGNWTLRGQLPDPWVCRSAGIEHLLGAWAGGQVGLFPEQAELRVRVRKLVAAARRDRPQVLDLFGYTGGSAIAAAAAGAAVTHVDSSRAALRRARENAARNGLGESALRSIPEHVPRFVEREGRRDARYDAVILDPPTFGRGSTGETWQIEQDLDDLLDGVAAILSDAPLFVALTVHTEAWTARHLVERLERALGRGGHTDSGSLLLAGRRGVTLSSGVFALRWF